MPVDGQGVPFVQSHCLRASDCAHSAAAVEPFKQISKFRLGSRSHKRAHRFPRASCTNYEQNSTADRINNIDKNLITENTLISNSDQTNIYQFIFIQNWHYPRDS